MILSAVLIPAEEGGYVAHNPETGTTTQGETVPEALSNLREATDLYLEEFPVKILGQALLTTFESTQRVKPKTRVRATLRKRDEATPARKAAPKGLIASAKPRASKRG